jgi:hypothetical protein
VIPSIDIHFINTAAMLHIASNVLNNLTETWITLDPNNTNVYHVQAEFKLSTLNYNHSEASNTMTTEDYLLHNF